MASIAASNVSTSAFGCKLPTIGYEHCENPAHAHALIREAREQGPIAMGPHGPEVLTYDLVRTVLRDNRFAMPQGLTLAAQGITSGELWDIVVKGLLSLNGEDHQRQRRLVSKAFTPKAASRLRTECADTIAGLVLAHRETGECDVVTDIAWRYPVHIICALLGIPRGDWQLLSEWGDVVFKLFDWDVVNDGPDIVRAWRALENYLGGVVDQRRAALTDDLLSDLIRAEIDGDRLNHDELINLTAGLLMAGTDTTRNQLAAAVQVFCEHPEQWALLTEHPDLVPRAVEEVMRYCPVIFAAVRKAAIDVEFGGLAIPAHTLVLANIAAANRDASVMANADEFDITRENPRAILTFGGGIHHCLGAHLARIELTEALTVMARLMPSITQIGPAPWKSLTGITGPTSLPIAFGTKS